MNAAYKIYTPFKDLSVINQNSTEVKGKLCKTVGRLQSDAVP